MLPAAQAERSGFWHPYQKRVIHSEARFLRLVWSRQIGKSTAISFRRLLRGIKRKRNQIFLSASALQSSELMLKMRQHVEAAQIAFEYSEVEVFDDVKYTKMEIALPSLGFRIIGLPANPRTARGFTGDVFLDEFAMHNDDHKIWAAVFPTILRGNGEIDVASTPEGRQNMFYLLGENESFVDDIVTMEDAVADGWPADPESIRKSCGNDEIYRQEFMCEFIDEATAFLTYELIGECEDGDLSRTLDLGALRDHEGDVVIGVDLGRKKDLTVIWAFEQDGRALTSLGMIELVDTPFRSQFDTLSKVLRCRCVRRCCIDNTGLGMQFAEEAIDEFGEHKVEACTMTASFKEQIATKLRVKFMDHYIAVPAEKRVRDDLHSIRKTVTGAGNIRLDAPRQEGSHADRFWAGALAVHAASDVVGPFEGRTGEVVSGHRLRDC